MAAAALFLAAFGCLIPAALAQAEILIKGGWVVNADFQVKADVLIKDGLIQQVQADIEAPDARVIDAEGHYVMPGGIDPHTHLDSLMFKTTACDDFFSGQAAALAGGTTMHIDFAMPLEGSIRTGFQRWRDVSQKAVMDYGFHVSVTHWDDTVAADMEYVVSQGVNSFKFFLAYKDVLAIPDADLLRAFQHCKALGALPMVHAENADALVFAQEATVAKGITGPEGHYISRPSTFEEEGTYRTIKLAEHVNVPLYVVHVMSGPAAALIIHARAAGQRVIGEAIASGIGADERKIFDPDFKVAAQFVMSPPIRNRAHQRQLKAALAGGGLQLVATDHCPFNSSQKAAGRGTDFRDIPNGVNGIEERLHVTWDELVNTGLVTPSDFVQLVSTAAAQIFNLYPRKGRLAPGSDADVVILDPDAEHVISAAHHHSNIDTNIYEGRKVKGKVVVTISRGEVVWEGGKLSVTAGRGRFLALPTFGPLFAGLDRQDTASIPDAFPYGPIPVQRSSAAPERDEL